MVLSLVNLSLITISNGIKDGTIQNPHMLPPNLRQPVLDTVLKRGMINDPKCLAILSSVDFLNGMTSISTSAGSTYDDEFLRRLIKSMGVKLPNGETMGDAIRKLDLSVYGAKNIFNLQEVDERAVKNSNFPTVSRLIAMCPNVTSLALRGVESDAGLKEEDRIYVDYREPWFPCLLNQNVVCKRVLENLIELSVSNWKRVLDIGLPIINFKQLTKLKLDNCSVHVNVWPELLRKIQTLEYLQIIDMSCVGGFNKGLDWALPFSMPHLKSLEVIGVARAPWYLRFNCNKAFVDNLMGCLELCQVHLTLDETSTDEANLIRLANMDIPMKIKARFTLIGEGKGNTASLDSTSKFKVVRIFHEKMDLFQLYFHSDWSPEFSTALEDAVTTCSNLTTFRICLPYCFTGQAEPISKEDMKRVNAALVRFFSNSERALQLKDLRLSGNFDETVVSTVFGNCLNLVQLLFRDCLALRDQHLIDWVSRDGGKLSHLDLCVCPNVTSEGIIPILARSAEGLLEIDADRSESSGGRNWEAVLNNHCPNAQIGDH